MGEEEQKQEKIEVLQKELEEHWKNTEEERRKSHTGKMYEKFLLRNKK